MIEKILVGSLFIAIGTPLAIGIIIGCIILYIEILKILWDVSKEFKQWLKDQYGLFVTKTAANTSPTKDDKKSPDV
jgi:hypothetical protein